MAGKPRPLMSGRVDSLGRAVKVSADQVGGSDAPPPPAAVTDFDGLMDGDREAVDAMFDAVPVSTEDAQYVLVVRDPDSANEFDTFPGVGRIEMLDVDLGAVDLDDEFIRREWVEGHLMSALAVADGDARAAYLEAVAGQAGDGALGAMVAYAASKPLRVAPLSLQASSRRVRDEMAVCAERMPAGWGLRGLGNGVPAPYDSAEILLTDPDGRVVQVWRDGDGGFVCSGNWDGSPEREVRALAEVFGGDAGEVGAAFVALHSRGTQFVNRFGAVGVDALAAELGSVEHD